VTLLNLTTAPLWRGFSLLFPPFCSLILVAIGFLEIALGEVSERVCHLTIQRATGLD
jgi:hypothetical protein